MLALTKIVPRSLAQARLLHTTTAPPAHRVGFPIKVVHMGIIISAMLSVPVYVAVNFKNYRGDA